MYGLVKLNKTVKEIHWNGKGIYPIEVVAVDEPHQQHQVTYRAKYAVMTFRWISKLL